MRRSNGCQWNVPGFNPDLVIEASFKIFSAVPDILRKLQVFQDRILTDVERLALATGAATYRWEASQ
jgi:hypothetical protein